MKYTKISCYSFKDIGSSLCNVEAACGNPWLWNYVLGVAKTEDGFHGLLTKGAKGIMQLRGFCPPLMPSESQRSQQLTFGEVAQRIRQFFDARGCDAFRHFGEPKSVRDAPGWVVFDRDAHMTEVEREWHRRQGLT